MSLTVCLSPLVTLLDPHGEWVKLKHSIWREIFGWNQTGILKHRTILSNFMYTSSKLFLSCAAVCSCWPSFHGNKKAHLWSRSQNYRVIREQILRDYKPFPFPSHWWDPAASYALLANFSHKNNTYTSLTTHMQKKKDWRLNVDMLDEGIFTYFKWSYIAYFEVDMVAT